MLYCRACRQLVQPPEPPACPACHAPLVELDKLSDEELDQLVVIGCFADIGEDAVVRAALEAQGIQTFAVEQPILPWISSKTGGGVTATTVLVCLRDAEDALDLLRRKESGELAIGEDDVPPPLPDALPERKSGPPPLPSSENS